jgi:PAS domain S-box-containing protein
MRCPSLISDSSPEIAIPFDVIHPAKMDEIVHILPKYSPQRSSATSSINPSPWKIAETRLRRSRNLPGNVTRERIAPVSRRNSVPDVEGLARDLHQARENFTTIFHASPAILCIIQLNSLRYCEINKSYERRTGYSRSEVLGKASLELGLWRNIEDRGRAFQKLLAKGSLRGQQEVFQTKTGESLTTFLSAEIIEFAGGQCALVIADDITEWRQAEEARMDLAQRLINAKEAECTRVARELHDNIGQSLALFTMDFDRTRLTLTDLSSESDAKLARLSGKLKDLGQVVSNLSHQLHSSELELLGLAVAIRVLCREFSEQYHVQVNCRCSGVPDDLSAEVSLCLFRVVQEALHNVAKHSQATTVDVEVRATPDLLHLSICDNGVGFTPNALTARSGLGLISMRERLHFVGGKFTITSRPGSGTRVEGAVKMPKFDLARVSPKPQSSPCKQTENPDSVPYQLLTPIPRPNNTASTLMENGYGTQSRGTVAHR